MDKISLSRRGLLAGAIGLGVASRVEADGARGRFTHNVASGDPLKTAIILWTRYVPASGQRSAAAAQLVWEVSTDASFSTIVKSGRKTADAARDYCVKVDVRGLTAGTRYFYRFRAGDVVSPTGETRTLPEGNVDKIKLATFSCSNLPFGYFHAYAHAASRGDIDIALHLGDYIYEYRKGNYPSNKQALADRPLDPLTEIVSLSDYRKRYANYRSDPDLQEIHRKLPFICVWDDHELANDAWKGGAQNHDPETQGAWAQRRAVAMQAYSEWMPIRDQRAGKIYRRFDIGALASLIMLDTRQIGRDKQLNYRTDIKMDTVSPRPEELKTAAAAFRKKWADPKRTMLGASQEKWLTEQVKRSAAKNIRWQVIGQQLQTGFLKTPAGLPKSLPADAPDWLRARVELAAQMSSHGLPANLDAWSGYPAARDRLLATLRDHANNALILAGDTHNAWLFELDEKNGRLAAVEFCTQSVTSPGFEGNFRLQPEQIATMMLDECPELKWCQLSMRGYMVTTLTPAAAVNEWIFLSTIRERSFQIAATKTARVAATDGKGTAKAELV